MDNNEIKEMNQEVMQEPEMKKKKTGFFKGMLIGLFTGILLVFVGGYIGINIYQNATGYPLLLSKKGVDLYINETLVDQNTAIRIDELMKYVDFYYDGEVDTTAIRENVYHAIVEGLGDPYSTYFTEAEYADFQTDTSGSFCGIGAGLLQDAETMQVTITKVYDNTPAQEAGIKDGDILISADDAIATEMDLTALVNRIRGEAGTTVKIKVYRESTEETLEFDVVRRQVDIPSVKGEMLTNDTGYIQISEFQSKTVEQFKTIYNSLEDKGMENLVIDLRDNPGGLLDSVINLVDFILPKGTIVTVTNKAGQTQSFESDDNCIEKNIVVLVNGNSASASEIFAGAMKDHKYATILGTTTFGKGIVQSIFPLKNKDAIKLTTAKYYTPNGNYIHGVGIEPDIVLEYEPVEEYSYETDNQLQKALEILNAN